MKNYTTLYTRVIQELQDQGLILNFGAPAPRLDGIRTEFVRAIPRIGFAIAATVCALNAVAVLIAQENGEYVFGSMVAAATFGLFTIAASAFSEER